MNELAAMARNHQPGLIIADRTVGGEYEDFITPEQIIPEKPLKVPWESCITLGNYWKFFPNDNFKPAKSVIHMLAETCCKGGNLLLGIGPDPDGLIPAEAASRLREVGDWLKVNGESIYETQPMAPFASGDVRFTAKGGHAYAIVLNVNNDSPPPTTIEIQGCRPVAESNVILLSDKKPVGWTAIPTGFTVHVNGRLASNEAAWVLKFTPDA